MKKTFQTFLALTLSFLSFMQTPAFAQQRENIVLLPIEVSPEYQLQKDVIGAEIQKSLSKNFNVFYGEAVEQALEHEYKKEDCTAESCVQNVAILFNGEIVVDASLQAIGNDSYLTMRFLNVLTGELEAIKNEVCEACSAPDLVRFVGDVAGDVQLKSSDGLSALLEQQKQEDKEKPEIGSRKSKGEVEKSPSYWRWGLGALVLAAGAGGGGGGGGGGAGAGGGDVTQNPVDTAWEESIQSYSDNRSFVSFDRKRTRLEGSNSSEYFSGGTGVNTSIKTRNGVAFRDFSYSVFNSGTSFNLEIQNDPTAGTGTAHELLSFDRRTGGGAVIFDDKYDLMGYHNFEDVRLYQGTFGHHRERSIPDFVAQNKVALFLGGLESRHHLYAMFVMKEMPIEGEIGFGSPLGPNEYIVESHMSGNLTSNPITAGAFSFTGKSIGFTSQTANGGLGDVRYTVSDITLTKDFESDGRPNFTSANTRYINNIDSVWDFHNGAGSAIPAPQFSTAAELDFNHSGDGTLAWSNSTPNIGGVAVAASVNGASEAWFGGNTEEVAGYRRIVSSNPGGKFVYQLSFGGVRE